jgi:DNA-binding protein Fis
MKYGEALAAVEKLEGGAEIVEAVQEEVRKKNSEAKGLRDAKKALEARFRTIAGADESDDLETVAERIEQGLKATGKPGKGDDSRVAQLEKTVQDLKKANDAANAKAQAVLVSAKVKDALAKHNAIRPDDALKLMADSLKVDGDKISYLLPDGTEADLEDGVKTWLKDRPEWVRSSQQPGPGGAGTKQALGGKTETPPNPIAQLSDAFGGK